MQPSTPAMIAHTMGTTTPTMIFQLWDSCWSVVAGLVLDDVLLVTVLVPDVLVAVNSLPSSYTR